ncbi:cation diffusion facilitator family transporter [Herbiconiux sp. L3-i23]|uniref:cation diffusion facilitator family transporter n=1 Tax=Herbiconiux sp. L3-i23 TaxID=2905871 RepID=UPI002065EAE6|nr:cation diffusion facilitator family transporter [Herbiconiux sp. L3-i23]BDI21254.1 cation transporter [Herbiconiux sp. L3-i23]
MAHDHAQSTAGHPNRLRLAIALSLTSSVLIVELIGAAITGSLALLVDAAHMLTDAGGLAIALTAATLMLRPPTSRRTWGFRRLEVLAALAQAAVLLAVGVFAFIEGARRLFEPPELPSSELLVFGVIGLAANVLSILVLSSGRNSNLNLKAAFLEVLNDALGSVAVIVSALVITWTGWSGADAIAGMLISALIVPRTLLLMRDSSSVLLETTPKNLNLDEVRSHILRMPGVIEVHDLHASLIGTGLPILSAHVIVDDARFRDGSAPELIRQLQDCVAQDFDVKIEHSTFQLEPADHGDREHTGHS